MSSTDIKDKKYQTFWRRFFAASLDGIAVAPLSWIGILIWNEYPFTPLLISSTIIIPILTLSYTIGFVAKYGQTPGKMVTGVKILGITESKATCKQAFFREIVTVLITCVSLIYQVYNIVGGRIENRALGNYQYFIGFAVIAMVWGLLEFITMLTNKRRRAVHDFIAETIVIRIDPLKRKGLLILLLTVLVLNFIVPLLIKDTNIQTNSKYFNPAQEYLFDWVWQAAPLLGHAAVVYPDNADSILTFWNRIDSRGYFPQFGVSQAAIGTKTDESFRETNHVLRTRTAYDTNGIYFLFSVIDDDFARHSSRPWYVNNCIDFFLDTLPAKTIYQHSLWLANLGIPGLTKSSVQFQCGFNESGIDSVWISRYEADSAHGGRLAIKLRGYSTNDLREKLGITTSCIKFNPLQRYQQWYIPWKVLYPAPHKPKPDANLAFSVCYNDIDSADTSCRKASFYGMGGPYECGARAWTTLHLNNKDTLLHRISIDSVKHFDAEILFPKVSFYNGSSLYRKKPGFISAAPDSVNHYAYGAVWIDGEPYVFATSKAPDQYKYLRMFSADLQPHEDTADTWSPHAFIFDRNHNFSLADDVIDKWVPAKPDSNNPVSGLNSSAVYWITESVPRKGYTAKIVFQFSKNSPDNIASRRLDGISGILTVDNKPFRTKAWFYGSTVSSTPFLQDAYLGIAGDFLDSINLKKGAADFANGLVDRVNTPAVQFGVKSIDYTTNTLYVDSLAFTVQNIPDVCEGANIFEAKPANKSIALEHLKELCQNDFLVILCFRQNFCLDSRKGRLDSLSTALITRNVVERHLGKCAVIYVQRYSSLCSEDKNNIFYRYEPSHYPTGFRSFFRITESDRDEIICLDHTGKIIFRGEGTPNEVLFGIWVAKQRGDFAAVRSEIFVASGRSLVK